MIKFNENHIFGNYIKQLLKEFNLPHYNNGKWANDIPNYNYNLKIKNITRNLKINSNIYDSHTHEYLGEYLRFYRDYNKINLMPLYNCFSNNICSSLSIDVKVSENKTIHLSTNDEAHKIYMTPIKLDKEYTIAIDSDLPVEMWCGIYDKYQLTNLKEYANNTLTNNKTIDLPSLTYKVYNSLQFNNPILFEEILIDNLASDARFTIATKNISSNIEERKEVLKKILNKYEDNLKLFIKLPIDNDSSITILEGNYITYNHSIYNDKIFNYSDPNLDNKMKLLTSEPLDWKRNYSKYYQKKNSRAITTAYENIPKYEAKLENKKWFKFGEIQGYYVWNDGDDVYYSYSNKYGYPPHNLQYKLNKQTNTWEEKQWQGLTEFNAGDIWTDGNNIYYSSYIDQIYKHYVLNRTNSTWEIKEWNGFTEFAASYIWTDGNNIYCSKGNSQYKLDIINNTWIEQQWTYNVPYMTSIYGDNIWTDGTDIYDLGRAVLDKATNTWNPKSWNGIDYRMIDPSHIWTDGTNIYYSSIIDETRDLCESYILDKATSTWIEYNWNIKEIDAVNIWTDNINTYYSNYTYYYQVDNDLFRRQLVLINSSWAEKNWIEPMYIDGGGIWTDNNNIYYSWLGGQYILDLQNSFWNKKVWKTYFGNLDGEHVWTDGNNIYYSNDDKHYILDKNIKAWKPVSWVGLTNFDGKYIWSTNKYDITNSFIYYSNNEAQYILDKTAHKWIPVTWEGYTHITGDKIWFNQYTNELFYSNGTDHQYKLDFATNTWEVYNWTRFDNIDATNIWEIEHDKYYYSNDTEQYYFDVNSQEWIATQWNVIGEPTPNFPASGKYIWTDNENKVHCSEYYDYVLDITNHNWGGGSSGDEIYGNKIWTDGTNIYLSGYQNTNPNYAAQYIFIPDDHSGYWEEITWNGTDKALFERLDGRYIWKKDKEIYYSYTEVFSSWESYNQSLVLQDDVWLYKNWNFEENSWIVLNPNTYEIITNIDRIIDDLDGMCIWTDGTNIYYSGTKEVEIEIDNSVETGIINVQYKLVNNTWKKQEWIFPTPNAILHGTSIWKYKDNIYYSLKDTQYKLQKNESETAWTSTWTTMIWNGFNNLIGPHIWNDLNGDLYYSFTYNRDNISENNQYILDPTTNTWNLKVWSDNNEPNLGQYIWTDNRTIYYSDLGFMDVKNSYIKTFPNFEDNKYYELELNTSESSYIKYQNQSIINIKNIDKYSDDFNYITNLQLLRGNTHTSYPFADRLIEYLVGNTITSQEEISDNILRIQAVLTENNVQFKPYEKGIWQNKFRPYLYNKMYSSTKLNSFIDNHDILGYVDKETEKYYDYDPDHDEKTKNSISIAKVDIYPNIYKDSKK